MLLTHFIASSTRNNADFFPIKIHYELQMYSDKIPGDQCARCVYRRNILTHEFTELQKRRLRGKNYMTVRLTRKVKFIGLALKDIKVVMSWNLPLFNYFCNINTFMARDPTKCTSLKVYWELFDYTITKRRTRVWSPLIIPNKTRILLSLPRTRGTRHRIKYLTYFKQSFWRNLKIHGTHNSRKEVTWDKLTQAEGY